MASAKSQGLRLALGGAPNTPHTVPGFPGLYRPDVPTPVVELGLMTLAEAKDAAKNHPDAFELVDIANVDEALDAYDDAVADSKNAQREVRRRRPKGGDAQQLQDEIDATKEAK